MSKLLEDVLGTSSFGNLPIPSGFVKATEPSSCIPGYRATNIDFSGLGKKYKATDLLGYGFDSTCATCNNHYSIVFISGTPGNSSLVKKSTGLSSGTHFTLAIPIDNSITNGTDLCAYLLDEFCKPANSDFIGHFQQYTYKGSMLYIYDNRNNEIGGFWTSIYKYVSSISAEYIGPDIPIGTQYNPDDVIVTIEYTSYDNQIITEQLDPREYTLSSLMVNQYGANVFYAAYKGASDVRDSFVVNALPREIFKITCEYVGPDIHIYSHYDRNDIEVYVYYKNDTLTPHRIPISQCVITTTKVTQDGPNQYELTFDSSQLPYTTPQMVYKLLYTVNGVGIDYLSAVYTGPEIDIFHQYSTTDVRVTLVYKNGDIEPVPYSECIFDQDLIVDHAPFDTFEVLWIDDGGNHWTALYEVSCLGVIKVEVQYIGPDILIRDDYNFDNLIITAYLSNGRTIDVKPGECIFEDPTIFETGPNRKYLVYTDISDIEWTVFFDIPGIPRPISLFGEYLGITKFVEDSVPQTEIKVTLTQLISDTGLDVNNTETITLEPKDWFYVYGNIITKENDGWLTIGFEKDYVYTKVRLTARVPVPYFDLNKAYLVAWYEDLPVEVGHEFIITSVVVYLCEPGKDRLRLLYTTPGVIIEPGIVTRVGDNWFPVTFIHGRWTLTTTFPVEGVIYKEYPEGEFQVVYIVRDRIEEIDLTEEFRPYFEFHDVFNVTWEQFMRRVYDYWKDGTPYFGLFRITVPKNTGLFVKYASSWHVYCKNEHTLKAEIHKIYCDEIKEDEDNGETEERKDGSSE